MNDDPAGRGGQFRRGDPWRVDPCHSGIAVGGVILSETNDNGLEPHSELRMQSLFGSPAKPLRRDSLWHNPPPTLLTARFQGDTNNLALRALYTGGTLNGAATSKPFEIHI